MKIEELENIAGNIKDDIKQSTKEIGKKIENQIDNIQHIPNNLKNMDSSQEYFLFLFKIGIEEETFCGLSQTMTVRIISIIALIFGISLFIDAFEKGFFFQGFYKLIHCIFYLIIAFYSFCSTINKNSDYAEISYFISAILGIYYFICFAFDALCDYLRFVNLLENSQILTDDEVMNDIENFFIVMIYLYFVYILFCYYVNLKNGRNV